MANRRCSLRWKFSSSQPKPQIKQTKSYIRWNLSISNRLLLLLNERGRLERGRQALAQLYTVWYPQRPWLINVEIIIVTAQTPDQTNNMWLSFISWNLSIYNRLLLLNERGRQERGRQARAQLSTVWYPQRPRLIKVEIIIVMKISGCYGTFLNGLSF